MSDTDPLPEVIASFVLWYGPVIGLALVVPLLVWASWRRRILLVGAMAVMVGAAAVGLLALVADAPGQSPWPWAGPALMVVVAILASEAGCVVRHLRRRSIRR